MSSLLPNNEYGGARCSPSFSRVNLDTIGYVWTGKLISIRYVWTATFLKEKEKNAGMCGQGPNKHFLLSQVAYIHIELMMKRKHLPKIVLQTLLRRDNFFSQSLSKHHVD